MYVRIADSSGYRTKSGKYLRYATVSTPADHREETLDMIDRPLDLPSVKNLAPDSKYPSIAEVAADVARALFTHVGSIRYHQYLTERSF